MKTIGLIGGTSWYSTVDYYRVINETVNKQLGSNIHFELIEDPNPLGANLPEVLEAI